MTKGGGVSYGGRRRSDSGGEDELRSVEQPTRATSGTICPLQ